MKINDEKINYKSAFLSCEDPHEFIKIGADVIKKLVFIGDIPGLEGINRKVKVDRLIRKDAEKLAHDPKYFLKERTPVLVNKRNGHIIDGQHTVTSVLLFLREFPELESEFEMYLELWNIDTLEMEERIVRSVNSYRRNWKGTDYFNQGLSSQVEHKKDNFQRLKEVYDYLSIKFEGQKVPQSKLLTISGYCLTGHSISSKIKEREGELRLTDGDVVDAKDIIDMSFELESIARGTYIDKKGNEVVKDDFSLLTNSYWPKFHKLYHLVSFDKDRFLKYVEKNWKNIEWWDSEITTSLGRVMRRLLEVSMAAKAISKEDFKKKL